MATNKIESLDPALIRPGRIDRKIEFPLPDIKTKRRIFGIHTVRGGDKTASRQMGRREGGMRGGVSFARERGGREKERQETSGERCVPAGQVGSAFCVFFLSILVCFLWYILLSV